MILIFGLGSYPNGSGSSAALYLAKQGHQLVVTDLKPANQLHQPTLKKLQRYPNVKLILGKHRKLDIKQADYIVRNPGVPDNEYIRYAKQLGKPITNDVGIFLNYLHQHWSPQQVLVVGVTGTKGKSTTTSLISTTLQAHFGKSRVHCGGNIGHSPLNFLAKIKPGHIVVLELSSWLLRDLTNPRFNVTVVTNLLPDHLNYYRSLEDYQADKERIFFGQTITTHHAVLNAADARVKRMAKKTSAQIHWFMAKHITHTHLFGEHNAYNIGAAWEVGKIFGVPPAIMCQAIQRFKGVPNRLEKIRTLRGRTFYNDTTATSPAATMAALRAFKRPVILIAGGNSKCLSLAALAQTIKKRVKTLILLPGNANHEFPQGLAVQSMREAVTTAWQQSQPGDIILLSPGVTWLPAVNEFERGRQFVHCVKTLA